MQYWICYDVPLLVVTFPPDPCQCMWGIDFRLETVFPLQIGNPVADHVQIGLVNLGHAKTVSDPGQAAQYHDAAMNSFTVAAQLLGGWQMPAPIAGHVWSPNGPFVPGSAPGVQLAADYLTDGISLLQQWLATQDPQLWDLVVPMFDAAYDALATP